MTSGGNAETIFFKALENIVGARYIKAGKFGRRITSSDVFLDKDYSKYNLSASVKSALVPLHNKYRAYNSDHGKDTSRGP